MYVYDKHSREAQNYYSQHAHTEFIPLQNIPLQNRLPRDAHMYMYMYIYKTTKIIIKQLKQ